jgi:hypothetical protein
MLMYRWLGELRESRWSANCPAPRYALWRVCPDDPNQALGVGCFGPSWRVWRSHKPEPIQADEAREGGDLPDTAQATRRRGSGAVGTFWAMRPCSC